MAGIHIIIMSDWTDIDKELDRLESMPTDEMKARLGETLEKMTESIRAVTHVVTGSLKGSERSEILPSENENEWRGQFVAGGPSTGINNPVRYAAYERARGTIGDFGRGLGSAKGDHNFLAPAEAYQDVFLETIRAVLQGDE